MKNLTRLRSLGWSVAVHNDYKINGLPMTFWLFTHSNGRWVKGEATSDQEAVNECLRQALNETSTKISLTEKQDEFVVFDVRENNRLCGTVAINLSWSENDVLVELRRRCSINSASGAVGGEAGACGTCPVIRKYPLNRNSDHIAVFRDWPSAEKFTITWGEIVFAFVSQSHAPEYAECPCCTATKEPEECMCSEGCPNS